MSVSCLDDVWDIAEKHSREAVGMGVAMSGFARWKMRTWGVKGRRKRVPRTTDMDPPARPPAFQLFGCIRLEESADGTRYSHDPGSVWSRFCAASSIAPRSAPSPAEALGLRRTLPLGFDETPENVGVENVPDAAALLLIVLDARYTLVYRERRGAGVASGTMQCEAVAASSEGPSNSSSAPDDSVGGLELTVVEGKRALSGQGAGWLLSHAKGILENSCRDLRHSTEAGDSGGGS